MPLQLTDVSHHLMEFKCADCRYLAREQAIRNKAQVTFRVPHRHDNPPARPYEMGSPFQYGNWFRKIVKRMGK